MLKLPARRALGALFLFAFVLTARAELNPATPLPVSPLVKTGKLANGLTYYLQKNSRPAQKLELRLVIKAGSILEDDDQQGMAHLLEHMAFNGSTHFKKAELVSYLETIGVKFGADLNAYTSFDETVYILPIPTNKRANVDKGFQVLRDWAGGLALDAANIDEERPIVIEELRLGKGARDRMNKVLLPKLYNGSRYAQRLPIGKEEIISKGEHAALRRFYKDWYRPNLMAVVVVGDIDAAEAERLVRQHFSDLKNPANERARFEAPISPRNATEAVVITDKEANGTTLLIRYPVKEAKLSTTIGTYREDLVQVLFTTILNQRLQELTQLAAPPFMGASSSVANLTARYEAYSASAGLGKGGATPAIEALVQEHARASKFGFTAAELERAKKNLLRQVERAYNERDKTESANLVGEFIDHFLNHESIPGIENEFNYTRELVPGISLDEVNRYARETIPSDASKLVVYMGAAKSELPTPSSEQLLAAFCTAEKIAVSARDEKAVAASLMEKPPVAGKIVAESEDKRLGTTMLTLSNGVKVLLKPTDFRNDQVMLSAARYGGQSVFNDADIINARYASAVAGAMGTGAFAPVELRKMLAGKTAGIAASLGMYTETLGGASGSADIETMFQMLYLKLTTVRRDPDLFQSMIGKQVEAARNALAQPEAVFQDTQVATLFNDHPRVPRVPRPEEFTKIDLDRALAIHKERFSSAKGLTFILVGSFDIAKIKPLIATYMASLPAPDLALGYKDVGIRPVAGVVKKDVRVGAEDKSRIALTFTAETEYSEDAQMRLSALIEVMNIRIIEVLREKMALIYGGGMSGSIGRVPHPNYVINVALPTGPANVDKVIATMFEEIERMKATGPTKVELEKVRQIWLQNHQKALRENGFWTARLQAAQLQGDDPALILTYEKRVNALSTDDVKKAAQRYFDTKNYVQVVMYPEK
ncbi:MAG: insulinase family protein [Bdellovibrionales bacterium]|nr:insulinase family protein [Massilia sp.]